MRTESLHPPDALPVLVISDLDPAWSSDEFAESVQITERIAFELQTIGHPTSCIRVEEDNLAGLLSTYSPGIWVVFNWCEAIPGIPRSGALAAQALESLGFTFTGASSTALALGQDKRKVKKRLNKHGIPTPRWQIVMTMDQLDWSGYPAIVKPAFEHFSFGITRESVVQSDSELLERIEFVLQELKQPAMVEDFIDGREFHIGVMGNRDLQVLQPAEIDFSPFPDIHDRLVTFESNFDKSSSAYRDTIPKFPAGLSSQQGRALEEVVSSAYRATGCRDYARMDVRLQDDIFYVLDVNHNADICPENSLIQAAELAGYCYGDFCSLLVRLAAHRHPIYGEMESLSWSGCV